MSIQQAAFKLLAELSGGNNIQAKKPPATAYGHSLESSARAEIPRFGIPRGVAHGGVQGQRPCRRRGARSPTKPYLLKKQGVGAQNHLAYSWQRAQTWGAQPHLTL